MWIRGVFELALGYAPFAFCLSYFLMPSKYLSIALRIKTARLAPVAVLIFSSAKRCFFSSVMTIRLGVGGIYVMISSGSGDVKR